MKKFVLPLVLSAIVNAQNPVSAQNGDHGADLHASQIHAAGATAIHSLTTQSPNMRLKLPSLLSNFLANIKPSVPDATQLVAGDDDGQADQTQVQTTAETTPIQQTQSIPEVTTTHDATPSATDSSFVVKKPQTAQEALANLLNGVKQATKGLRQQQSDPTNLPPTAEYAPEATLDTQQSTPTSDDQANSFPEVISSHSASTPPSSDSTTNVPPPAPVVAPPVVIPVTPTSSSSSSSSSDTSSSPTIVMSEEDRKALESFNSRSGSWGPHINMSVLLAIILILGLML